MELLGVIPARGDSKGIARKNVAPLCGKPLLAWTCEAALACPTLTRVVVSTDDQEIADVAKKYGVSTPFLRPPELAQDDTPMIPVLQHLLRTMEEREQYRPDAIVLLQPTSPLRTAAHITRAIQIFTETGADTVVSVTPVAHNVHPHSLMRMQDGELLRLDDAPLKLRRQDKEPLYARNGPAIIIVRTTLLLQEGIFYGKHCKPFVMDRVSSVDIDDAEDLAYAEFLLSRA